MSTPGGNGKKPLGGGRGLLLDLIQRQKAQREQQLAEQRQQEAATSTPAPSVAPSVSRGRAELLAKLRQQSSTVTKEPQVGESTSSDSSVPKIGAGRAALLKKFVTQKAEEHAQQQGQQLQAQQQETLQKTVQESVKQPKEPTTSSGSGSKTELSGPIGQLERLSVEDSRTTSDSQEPVIKRGSSGEKVTVASNYINISFKSGFGIFLYVVKFQPNIESIPLRRFLLRQHTNVIGEVRNFDGCLLYVPQKLKFNETTLTSTREDGEQVEIKIIFKKQVHPSEHMAFFNVLLRRVMASLQLVPIGRQNFCPRTGHKLSAHRLELWPGYVTAISEVEGGLKLCIDATHRAIRTETVHALLNQIAQKNPQNFQKAALNELVSTSVITRHNNKVYRIDDIAFNESPKTTFERGDTKISIIQYYREQWNVDIKDVNQPLLVHNATKRTTTGEKKEQMLYLVPELCNLTGLTDSIRNDFRVMKDIIQITQVLPENRRETIRNFIKEVRNNEAASQILSRWGIEFSDDIIDFQGRVVPPEMIYFGNNKTVKVNEKASWSGDAVKSAVLETPNINSWAIIYTQNENKCATDFIKMLHNVKKSMQIQITQPHIYVLQNDRTDTYVSQLRNIINDKLELVVIIFPTNRTDRYSAVKKICCAELPIASQCIMKRTISDAGKLKSVVEKIALQINCKLGGTLWALKVPMKKTMVIGVDVYHSGVGQKKSSVIGFVASINTALTKWYSKTATQHPHQEIVDVLKSCLILSIKNFYEYNGHYPERIIMYRDGVGDGQLETVSKYEIPQLLATFSSIVPDYNPQLGVVIVQKRINTRLMLNTGRNLVNVPSGTVVDQEVTRRNYYDFYLVPQTTNRGTVTPTHYVVLYDNSELTVDQMQRLSYKLCHLYYNWPGTIRVPAPCQYAHKIAYLIGQNVQVEPHDVLSNRLYYL